MFDKRQLKKAYKMLKIGSDWIRLDQIGSDRIGFQTALDQIGLDFRLDPISDWMGLDQTGWDWIR